MIRVGMTGCGTHLGAVIQNSSIDLHMALGRRYKANGAMPMLVVVPMHAGNAHGLAVCA